MEKIMEKSVYTLLKLMYKTCRNQSQRIKDYLVLYKAAVSLCIHWFKALVDNEAPDNQVRGPWGQEYAAKIIKIQIKYQTKNWRKNNMKIVSLVY